MTQSLQDLATLVTDRAKQKGATSADAFIREDESFAVTVRQREVETVKESLAKSLRLRVFLGNRTATSQTSDLSPERVEKLVDETVEMAGLTSEDESGGLPDSRAYPASIADLGLSDRSWSELTPAARIDLAQRAEGAAFKESDLITNSEGSSFECERSRIAIASTNGFAGAYEGTLGYIVCVPIAQLDNTMQQDHWLSISRFRDRLDAPEIVGRHAAQRALRRLGARKIKTCEVPIVFDPQTSRTLLKHVFDAVSGDAIYRKRSFLVGQVGQKVASDTVTIVDDACLPAGLGSSPFDGEGVATGKTTVIENGVLRNYLHSVYTGRKLGERPTGNGVRTATGSIAVGPTNFYLSPGKLSPSDIIGSVQKGLYVVDLIGFGVNTVNGDYSRGATGIWIENGKLSYPVHEITIAGNLRQMLHDIELVGTDLTFMSSVAAPTLKIRSMTVSGE